MKTKTKRMKFKSFAAANKYFKNNQKNINAAIPVYNNNNDMLFDVAFNGVENNE